MLQNAYFLAKFGLDTAENEPARSLQNLENESRKIQMFNVANNTNLLTLQLLTLLTLSLTLQVWSQRRISPGLDDFLEVRSRERARRNVFDRAAEVQRPETVTKNRPPPSM